MVLNSYVIIPVNDTLKIKVPINHPLVSYTKVTELDVLNYNLENVFRIN